MTPPLLAIRRFPFLISIIFILNLNSAVEIVARAVKVLKMEEFLENFLEAVVTATVRKNFPKILSDSVH